ncbi:MAG: hypothetical protein M1827_001897 [Pycnora praestabilis]|nr:MAG: hypothetical protein M1827_001897 [Pycnora praestabilis]
MANHRGWKHNEDAVPFDSAMEIAGRNHDHVFQDLRSASKARKRTANEAEKYNYFRITKRGQLGALHLKETPYLLRKTFQAPWGQNKPVFPVPDESENVPLEVWTKRELYAEARQTAHMTGTMYYHHARRDAKGTCSWEREEEERRHAKEMMSVQGQETRVLLWDDDMGEFDAVHALIHYGECLSWGRFVGNVLELQWEGYMKTEEAIEEFRTLGAHYIASDEIDQALAKYHEKLKRAVEEDGWSVVTGESVVSDWQDLLDDSTNEVPSHRLMTCRTE